MTAPLARSLGVLARYPQHLPGPLLEVFVTDAIAAKDFSTLEQLAAGDLTEHAHTLYSSVKNAKVTAAWLSRTDVPDELRSAALAKETRTTVLTAANLADYALAGERKLRDLLEQSLLPALRAGHDKGMKAAMTGVASALQGELRPRAAAIGDVLVDLTSPRELALLVEYAHGLNGNASFRRNVLGAVPEHALTDALAQTALESPNRPAVTQIITLLGARHLRDRLLPEHPQATDPAWRHAIAAAVPTCAPVEWLAEYAAARVIDDPGVLELVHAMTAASSALDHAIATLGLLDPTPSEPARQWLQQYADQLTDVCAACRRHLPLLAIVCAINPAHLLAHAVCTAEDSDAGAPLAAATLDIVRQQDYAQQAAWWDTLNRIVSDYDILDTMGLAATLVRQPEFDSTYLAEMANGWVTVNVPAPDRAMWPAVLVVTSRRPDVMSGVAADLNDLLAEAGPDALATLATLTPTFTGRWGELLRAARLVRGCP